MNDYAWLSIQKKTQKSPEGRHVSFYTRWKLLLPNTLQTLTWWACIQSGLCLSYTSTCTSVKLLWLRQAYWIHRYKSYFKKSMLTNVKRKRWFWGHFCFNFLSSFSFTEVLLDTIFLFMYTLSRSMKLIICSSPGDHFYILSLCSYCRVYIWASNNILDFGLFIWSALFNHLIFQ